MDNITFGFLYFTTKINLDVNIYEHSYVLSKFNLDGITFDPNSKMVISFARFSICTECKSIF